MSLSLSGVVDPDAGAVSPHLQALTVPTQRGADLPRGVAEALAAVDAASLVSLVQELVAVPTVTGSAAESEGQHRLEARLRAAGMDTDLWSVDLAATTSDPEFPGMEAPRDEAWGLVGAWGGGDGPTVVLNGHLDVVPPGSPELWTTGPWDGTVRDGRVLGRGTCDMKGGLACQVMAVEALRSAGVRLRGTVQLQSVVGEEDGGLGTFATLRRGYRGDLAVICEPTSGGLVTAAAGALTFRLTVPGRSVHASMRLEGVDAVEKYLLVHQALRRLEAQRNRDVDPLMTRYALPYPLSVGTVRSGDWASSVPDLLVAEGRLGVALGEPVEQARAALQACVAEVCAGDPWLSANPVRVEWCGGQFASGSVPATSPVAQLVSRTHDRLHGRVPDVHGVPYGSDLRLMTGIGGVPTVHYGPGNVRHAHAPDESVPVSELVDVTRTLVLLIATACGVS
ncbi:MAG: acetylornithine deacetylase [Frankiales bacterium]|nr:acetylornithine deacetylase [Frankiales bacterium]